MQCSPSGYIPRDYSSHPSGYQSCAPSAPDDWLVDEAEWDERLREQQARLASLWDLREMYYSFLRSLNQTNHPLCWAFSTTKAEMYLFAAEGTPIILSPWWTAGVANGWRNQGGWGASSLDGAARIGPVPMEDCPDFTSRYDTSATRAIAAKRRVIEWYDGSEDRDRNRHIMISSFLLGLPNVLDFNDIGHSMAGCRIIQLKPKLIIACDNSWDAIDQYGAKGTYQKSGNAAIPDGVVVPRVIQPTE